MKHRVFIAINLPEGVKKRLKLWQEAHDELPVRWTKEPSLHLTLVFIGYVSSEQVVEICRVARETAQSFEPFEMNIDRIIFGPLGKNPPRMIWLTGEPNKQLSELKTALEDALLNCDSGLSHVEKRSFKPHITLARIQPDRWAQLTNSPAINESFSARFDVNSIEVMESDLKHDGAEYAVMESCELKT